ncbi:hypothetical protein BN1013_00822 [Candidatus Rubidus massiliensis]|nr:MAG: hypothetical protein BGO10_03465 [Chlamydia sp. 32-24]CDZ80312.1 hypothetical protein BN1013_00822 [Candidatus Rubidus massiliensis]
MTTWEIDPVFTPLPKYNFSKIFFPIQNEFDGIEVEIVKDSNELQTYLVIHSIAIGKRNVMVTLTSGDDSIQYPSLVLKGGQKIVLPKDGTQQLINWLLENRLVTISFERYKTTVANERFSNLYKELLEIPVAS